MAMSQQLAGSLSKKMLTLEGKTKLLVSNKERKKEKLLTSENLTKYCMYGSKSVVPPTVTQTG